MTSLKGNYTVTEKNGKMVEAVLGFDPLELDQQSFGNCINFKQNCKICQRHRHSANVLFEGFGHLRLWENFTLEGSFLVFT